MTPRILVSGWAGAGNIGDELLHRELLTLLRAQGATPVVVSRDPAATAVAHGVESVAWGPRGLTVLRQVDGVCVGPGGLFQDTSSLWSMPGNLFVPLLARRLGLPIASIGVGAGPLKRRSSGWLLRQALSDAAIVTRDDESSAALADHHVEATTAVDLVFAIESPVTKLRNEILVAIGPAVAPGALRPAASRLESVAVTEIAPALDRLASRTECTVVFGAFRGERDRVAAHEVAAAMATPTRVLPPEVDLHVEQVAASRLVISSRYHPVVLAGRFGTPALVLSQQEKVHSLVQQIDRHRPDRIVIAGSWPEVGSIAIPSRFEPLVLPGLEQAEMAAADLVHEARAQRR